MPALPYTTNDRTEHSLTVAYTVAFSPKFVAQPYYRAVLQHYTNQDGRNDQIHTVGLSLYYYLSDRASLRTFLSYELKESDQPTVADYKKFDVGAGLNLNVRF